MLPLNERGLGFGVYAPEEHNPAAPFDVHNWSGGQSMLVSHRALLRYPKAAMKRRHKKYPSL